MSKLLTISIPTYNRAQMLDRQLKWIASDIVGYESYCDIIISDNCSTDNTEKIVEMWKSILSPQISLRYYRNDENIGGMANIALCLLKASGKFVWSLGDDDAVQNGTISYLLSKIKRHSDLSVILLNGFGRDLRTDKIITERFFDSTSDTLSTKSVSEFEHVLTTGMGGVLFISSAVYRTELLHKAFRTWPESAKNLASQAFWVAFCAARGRFIVTPFLYTECAMGIGFTDKDPQWMFKMIFREIPDVYLRLMKTGYSRSFCLTRIIRNLWSSNNWRILLGALRRWPIFATRAFIYYMRSIAIATTLCFGSKGRQMLLEDTDALN
jgi:abequosyltransferase